MNNDFSEKGQQNNPIEISPSPSSSPSSSKSIININEKELKEKHKKIISDLHYHLNKQKEKIGSYNPEKRLFDNYNSKKNKLKKPYVKILTESQYYEKMIISELIEEFNMDYFFSKMKDKLFINNLNFEEVINEKLFKNKDKISYSIKGGSNLKNSGDNLLKILHIFDAKHDFDKYKSIKTYIDVMYDNYIISSSFSQAEKDIFQSLYERNGANYEEMILQYILIHNKDIFDSVDDNANVIYIDVNTDATKFEYFSKENKDKNREGFDIDADDQETIYNALINIIKTFYDFKETPDKYGYIFDTNISSVKYDGLGETYHHIKEGVFDKISEQLFPFENAYDPHSSTEIKISDAELDIYNEITNLNFNNKIVGKEHESAIRDLTRKYFMFSTKKIDDLYFPNIKLNICDINDLNNKIDRISILSDDNKNIIKGILNIYNFSSSDRIIKHPIFNKLIFNLDITDNKINITYEKSFNSIDIIKTFIEKFIKYERESDAYTNLLQEATAIVSSDKSELWLLFVLVIYLMVSNEHTTFTNKKKEIISILFDFKKSGDWAQSLFCSKYNDISPNNKEAYFISGDKLSAARAILNGNVKTMTATDYNILEMNITHINAVEIIKNKKKSILTLYNGKNKFKFNDLYKLIEGSIFEFYAFNDIDKGRNLFNFDEIIFNNFKKVSGLTNDTIIDNTNFNFEYFWYFMIVIIYHIRTYIDTYSVFKVNIDGFEELSYNKDRLTFNYNKHYQDALALSRSVPLTLPPNNFYRKFESKEEKYKIMQLSENIFKNNDINSLIAYLKLIDNNRIIFYNGDLDKKYLKDIVNILKDIFGDAIIPEYNYIGSDRFCEYLNNIYKNILLRNIANYDNFIKFFRKFAKLITLCQILYIDNIMKEYEEEDKIPFNKIHSIVLTAEHKPKTICKIIVDKFYNDICLLYENFQSSTEKIGDDVYLNALKNIILSYSTFEDRIKYIDEKLLYPLENLKFKLNILNNLIKKHNSTSRSTKLKEIIDDQDQYNILLSLNSYDFIKKNVINIIDDNPADQKIKDIQALFDKFDQIYKKTYEKIPELELNKIIATSSLDKELLKNYYNIFRYSDIKGFFNELKLLKSEILMNVKYLDKLYNVINNIQKNNQLEQPNIKILEKIHTILRDGSLIAEIEEIKRNKNDLQRIKRFLTYFKNKIIDPFKEVYEIYKETAKQNRLRSILEKLDEKFIILSNSLFKKLDDKLYEYFNCSVLSWYVLKDYIDIPDSKELLKDIQKSYIEAVKPVEIRKLFKDKETTLDDVYYEIINIRDKLKENIQIEKLNIEKIYDFDKSSEVRQLKIPESFLKKGIFFYPDLKDIMSVDTKAVVKTGQRERIPNSRFITETAKAKIKVDDKIQLKNWHTNSKSYNQIYKILTKDDTLPTNEIIISNETLSNIFDGIFKNKEVRTFIKPEIEIDMNDDGNIDKFFLNTGFILMVSKILEKTMNKYTSIIKNITSFDKTLNINSFLTIDKNYYNDDKYKIITIIGSYTKFMLGKKLAYINENSKKYGIYRFDKLFRTKIFPNSTSKIDSICSILDTLMVFTKSKYLIDAKDEYNENPNPTIDTYLKSMNIENIYIDKNEKLNMHDTKYPYFNIDEITAFFNKSLKISDIEKKRSQIELERQQDTEMKDAKEAEIKRKTEARRLVAAEEQRQAAATEVERKRKTEKTEKQKNKKQKQKSQPQPQPQPQPQRTSMRKITKIDYKNLNISGKKIKK
jgi:hypothetical protein